MQLNMQLNSLPLENKQNLTQTAQFAFERSQYVSENLNLNSFQKQSPQISNMKKTQMFLNLTVSQEKPIKHQLKALEKNIKEQSESWETVDQNSCQQEDFNKQCLRAKPTSEFPKINKDSQTMGESDQETEVSLSSQLDKKLNIEENLDASVKADKNKMRFQYSKHKCLSFNKKYEDEEEDLEEIRNSNAFLKQKLAKMMELLNERTSQLQKKQMKIKNLQVGLMQLKQQNTTLEAQKNGLLKLIM